ncbi:MAG: DUF2490 domain-containing protein [Brumimicrobium sp.]
MINRISKKYGIIAFALICITQMSIAQEYPTESTFDEAENELWFGTYGNFRLTEKFYWAGEFHTRMKGSKETPLVDHVSKLYNRHGIKYVHSKKFSATVGGVLRLNFSKYGNEGENKALVLEPRIWHEYVFAMPFERFMIYHRIRIEHRWSKPNFDNAEFIYRNRYRYMIQAKIPINNRKLIPGTYYFAPFIELIMQSGKPIVGNPMEDLRLYPHFGYIFNPRISASAGLLFTTGQSSAQGYSYRRRWIPRVNLYISLDWRKEELKIPEINLRD